MDIKAKIDKGLKSRWQVLDSRKTTIYALCERYAQWTLPYIFPRTGQDDQAEMPGEIDAIGAQGVNHLSNRIVSTLFPAKSLFFRLQIDQEMRDLLEAALTASGELTDPDQVKSELETQIVAAETELQKAEKRVEDRMDMVQYRPQAINAAKHLIITGNALEFHPEDGSPVQVYGLRNFHVVRDCNGEVVEIMTRETKAFETFHPDVQNALRMDIKFKHLYDKDKKHNEYEDSANVSIYTRILLEDDGRFHVTQYADDVKLDTNKAYTRKELRWIPLVWNLVQGEDYGRGLVADYAGAFHGLQTLNGALLNLAAIMGDVKFFVDPASFIDVVEVQNSLPGSYHVGKSAEIGTAQFNKMMEANFLETSAEKYRKQLAQAFMLTTQLTRQAERVTAEEIRRDVDELEMAHAGVYSRYAAGWQVQLANILLQDTGFGGVGDGVDPKVITGMDSLSRAGEAYNMRLFIGDLALLNGIPEDVRMAVKKPQFIKQIAQYHQVPYESWVMTDAELAAVQQAETDRQAQLQQQQGDQQIKVETAKAAAKSAE